MADITPQTKALMDEVSPETSALMSELGGGGKSISVEMGEPLISHDLVSDESGLGDPRAMSMYAKRLDDYKARKGTAKIAPAEDKTPPSFAPPANLTSAGAALGSFLGPAGALGLGAAGKLADLKLGYDDDNDFFSNYEKNRMGVLGQLAAEPIRHGLDVALPAAMAYGTGLVTSPVKAAARELATESSGAPLRNIIPRSPAIAPDKLSDSALVALQREGGAGAVPPATKLGRYASRPGVSSDEVVAQRAAGMSAAGDISDRLDKKANLGMDMERGAAQRDAIQGEQKVVAGKAAEATQGLADESRRVADNKALRRAANIRTGTAFRPEVNEPTPPGPDSVASSIAEERAQNLLDPEAREKSAQRLVNSGSADIDAGADPGFAQARANQVEQQQLQRDLGREGSVANRRMAKGMGYADPSAAPEQKRDANTLSGLAASVKPGKPPDIVSKGIDMAAKPLMDTRLGGALPMTPNEDALMGPRLSVAKELGERGLVSGDDAANDMLGEKRLEGMAGFGAQTGLNVADLLLRYRTAKGAQNLGRDGVRAAAEATGQASARNPDLHGLLQSYAQAKRSVDPQADKKIGAAEFLVNSNPGMFKKEGGP